MNKIYKPNQFSKRIGVSVSTLRRWDGSGKLKARRTISNHRYYDESDIKKLFGIKEDQRKIVVYCRVSSSSQRDDLISQKKSMEQFCLNSSIIVDEWIDEIAGGMNFKRKKFLNLMSRIQTGEVSNLLIAHKDRLVRFGFDYFEYMANENGCQITVINHESLSPQREMVEDLMAIIHTFSCRLYGLRRYKKEIKNIVKSNESYPNNICKKIK